MPAKTLSFSVMMYSICAVLCVCTLVLRRYLPIFGKGELGGPFGSKMVTGVFLIGLWVIYVLVSSLVVYDHIAPPF